MLQYLQVTCYLLVLLLSIFQIVHSAPIQRRQNNGIAHNNETTGISPIIFNFDIVRKSSISGNIEIQNKNIRKVNQSQLIVELENEISMYTMEIELGTPKQLLNVILDTGSSDLWVPSIEILKTEALVTSTRQHGAFNASESTTFKEYDNQFRIGYDDSSTAEGIWANDTLSVKEFEVNDMIFGYATSCNTNTGIFGIGMRDNEASSWILQAINNKDTQLNAKDLSEKGINNGFYYDNFPYLLKKKGYVKNCGYSLFLNSFSDSKGSIIFGAIDTEKYYDSLQNLHLIDIDDVSSNSMEPAINDNSTISSSKAKSFYVSLNSLTTTYGNGTTSDLTKQKRYPALLDSGASLIYAPYEIADKFQTLHGTFSKTYNHYITPCNTKGPNLEFLFSNKTISVPFENLLFKVDKQSEDCVLGIANSQTDYFILGDAFLRSSYVYYNLENKTVSIAQANYNKSTNLEIVE